MNTNVRPAKNSSELIDEGGVTQVLFRQNRFVKSAESNGEINIIRKRYINTYKGNTYLYYRCRCGTYVATKADVGIGISYKIIIKRPPSILSSDFQYTFCSVWKY